MRGLFRSTFVWLLAGVLLMALAGCKAVPTTGQQPVMLGFACDMAGTYRETQVEGKLTRSAVGMLTIELTKPDHLAGMTMEWDGQSVQLKMSGLSVPVDPSLLPESGLGASILDALDTAVLNKQMANDGTVNGTGDNGAFTMKVDPENGYLQSLSVPELQLDLTFSNFEPLAAS